MHKDIPVCDIILTYGHLTSITKKHNPEHAPIGTNTLLQPISPKKLESWFNRRHVPNLRTDIETLLNQYGQLSTESFLESTLALSLSDTYWIRPASAPDLTWEQTNLFQNNFNPRPHRQQIMPTADASSSGDQKKNWIIGQDNTRYLIKQSRPNDKTQSPNEEIGSRLCQQLGIEHITYRVINKNNNLASICPCVINHDEDYVTAYDILQSDTNIHTDFDAGINWLWQQMEEHSLDFETFVSDLSLVDVTIRNQDRHWTNFGIIRNADNLEWKRTFPLYDFGNSLYFDSQLTNTEPTSRFSNRLLIHDLKYVTEIQDKQLEILEKLPQLAAAVYEKSNIDQNTIKQIITTIENRNKNILQTLTTLPRKDPEWTKKLGKPSQKSSMTPTKASNNSNSTKSSDVKTETSSDAQVSSYQETLPSSMSNHPMQNTSTEQSYSPTASVASEEILQNLIFPGHKATTKTSPSTQTSNLEL